MALTWARIAFIPLIVGVFYVPDVILSPHVKNLLACVMFVVAAITAAITAHKPVTFIIVLVFFTLKSSKMECSN